MQALLELDCIPSGMELFPASHEEKWPLISRVIDDCDYYILILGGRYGSVDTAGTSYTEREYEQAAKYKKCILAFLHADPDMIPAGKSELGLERRAKLRGSKEFLWSSGLDCSGRSADRIATLTVSLI
jgi:hypothetical protein